MLRFYSTKIFRFLWILLIAETITIIAAWVLLNVGITIWINQKAKTIELIAKEAATSYDWSTLDQIPKHQADNPILLKYKKIFHILDQKYFPVNDGDVTAVKIINGKEYLIAGEETTDNSGDGGDDKADKLELEAMNTKATTFSSKPYSDDNGTQFSAYAPVIKNAQIIALLNVNLESSTVQNLRAIVKTSFWWSLIPATVISLFVSTLLASRFVEPMEFLKEIEEVKTHPEHVIPLSRISDKEHRLSKREHEVIDLIGCGLKNREISEKLSISEETVKQHLKNIFKKLEISSRYELVLYAISKKNSDSKT